MRTLKAFGSAIVMLAAFAAMFWQFRSSTLLPTLVALVLVAPVRWWRPERFRRALLVPLLGLALLLVDAFALHHLIAVKARASSWILGGYVVENTFDSPSGKTRVYLLGSSWLDAYYLVYISAGGLFPQRGDGISMTKGMSYRDLVTKWDGALFLFGLREPSYAYSESDHKAYSFDEWNQEPLAPPYHPKTREAFSAHIKSLQLKAERDTTSHSP